MKDINEKISGRYDRIARIYDILEEPMEKMVLSRWREELMYELEGKILEIGVGTGKNIEYYPEGADITAIDFSGKMLQRAEDRAVRLGKNVKLMLMDAQDMEFEDNTFDTVFTTCVFCSVPDPVKGLREIMRVCRDGGKIIMIEHVRSEGRIVGALMDILNPLVVTSYGANINRRTVENVRAAGFTDIHVENLWKDIVKKIVIHNVKKPHIRP
ncbi:Methyltransferase domain-containing protein [Peptoclostridium litorale DSM 5388]|uniref:Methyltransferase type 11 n=1 Tax=Peptoclostridium litorale DSM 5388 TaxID=1121324 RepID=A0A069RIA6_PEPLI|nr:class I SAM-dependent methyltransferase [Peptoclostridium litorale]KDR96759.1 methyltransferase type 11 [Peptoclostridium litorale DSM 5388]SIO34735.1 Methyltransferase domain-containing protein [Peptoclostridium litorale DSM 5388]